MASPIQHQVIDLTEEDDQSCGPVDTLVHPDAGQTLSPTAAIAASQLQLLEKSAQVWQLSGRNVRERIAPLLASNHLSDVAFLVGLFPDMKTSDVPREQLRRIPAHKFLLVTASPVFDVMFNGPLAEHREVVVTDVEPNIFLSMLGYVYTEKLMVPKAQLVEMLYTAEKYELPGLSEVVVGRLIRSVNVENVLDLAAETIRFEHPQLNSFLTKFVQENTKALITSPAFEQQPKESLALVLQQSRTDVVELELFDACHQWAAVNCVDGDKRQTLGDLLYLLRLPSMTATEFAEGPAKSGLFTPDEVGEMLLHKHSPKSTDAGGFVARFPPAPRWFAHWTQLLLEENAHAQPRNESISEYIEWIVFQASEDFYLAGFTFYCAQPFTTSRLLITEDGRTRHAVENFQFEKDDNPSYHQNFYPPLRIRAFRPVELSMQVVLKAPAACSTYRPEWTQCQFYPVNGKPPYNISFSHKNKFRPEFRITYLYLH